MDSSSSDDSPDSYGFNFTAESPPVRRPNRDHLFDSTDEESDDGLGEASPASSISSDEMEGVNGKEETWACFKNRPKHKWSVVNEVIRRERGFNKVHEAFSQRFYGSLHAVQRLELMYKLEEHTGCVNTISFNSNGSILASGSDDRKIVIWDWKIGKCLSSFMSGHSCNVFHCKFLPLPGETHIVTCSLDGQVRLATKNSLGAYESTTRLALHSKACHKLTVFNQSPHVFLSAGKDGWVFSIDIRMKRACTRVICVKEDTKKLSLCSIHSNPMTDNEFIVSASDPIIRMYDRRNVKKDGSNVIKFYPSQSSSIFDSENNNPLRVRSQYVSSAVFNYNGTEIVGSYMDDDIYLFDAKSGDPSKYVHKYEGHRNEKTVKGVNFFGPKSEFVVSGSDCGYVYFWDKNTESIVQWMRGDEDGVINCIEPHPKLPVLASSGLDSDVKIWVPSCETEPLMVGLQRTVLLNQKKREIWCSERDSFGLDFMRWWNQLETVTSTRPLQLPEANPPS